MDSKDERRQPQTLFGELLRQRRQSAEEFSQEAERFAREHGLNATISCVTFTAWLLGGVPTAAPSVCRAQHFADCSKT